MRLWVLTDEFEPHIIGGLGVVATQLSSQLANAGHTVTVFTTGKQKAVSAVHVDGLAIIQIPKTKSFYSRQKRAYYYRPVMSWYRHQRLLPPHLIHIHSVKFTSLAVHLSRTFHVPMVYTCHSLVVNEASSTMRDVVLERQIRLIRAADMIVVPSAWQMRELESHYPFCQGKVRVIPNGVQVASGAPGAQTLARLLFVGRLIPSKGIEELLHAMAILTALTDQEITLDIVGTGSGSYMAHLKKLVDKLNISPRIQWLGYRSHREIQTMYKRYSGVVVPSRRESFGLVALESLANGVPLISTQAGGLASYVTTEVAAVIAQIQPDTIAEAILSALQDPTETAKRVQKGVKLAADYTWDLISARYTKLFNMLYKG